jgi:hypothetical protein
VFENGAFRRFYGGTVYIAAASSVAFVNRSLKRGAYANPASLTEVCVCARVRTTVTGDSHERSTRAHVRGSARVPTTRRHVRVSLQLAVLEHAYARDARQSLHEQLRLCH